MKSRVYYSNTKLVTLLLITFIVCGFFHSALFPPVGKKTVKKHVVIYSQISKSEETVHWLNRFDYIVTGFSNADYAKKIKAHNPRTKIFFYRDLIAMQPHYSDWDIVNAHEDWFLHDLNGNRLQHSEYGWYLMDPTSPEWVEHYSNSVKTILDQYVALDGVFADDCWTVLRRNIWTVSESYVPEIPTWHSDMIVFLRTIKNVIGRKLLIPNTQDPVDYADVSDGKLQEGWIHYPWFDIKFPNKNESLDQIDNLASLSSEGKTYLAHSGYKLPEDPTTEQIKAAHKTMYYSLCCFLLGTSGPNASFGWLMYHITNGKMDNSRGYYPEMDIEIGEPRGKYYEVNSDVYGRDFDNAKVFVNFSNETSYQIQVGEANYTLPARTGVITRAQAN